MKTIRLAVIFDQQIHAGGGFQQSLNAALLAKSISNVSVEVIFYTLLESNVSTLLQHGIKSKYIKRSLFGKLRTYFRKKILNPYLVKFIKKLEPYTQFEKFLIKDKIDIVYFLSPTAPANDLEEINYISTVWDLCHRDYPEFPEVRKNKIFESREIRYHSVLPRAVSIIVESELGKKNVVNRYGVDQERVYVIPFQPGNELGKIKGEGNFFICDIRKKYELNFQYIFYPAQFWAHKNHIYILEGLRLLEEKYSIRIGAIFSGIDKGNLEYVRAYVKYLKLESRVKFIGFVDKDEITCLYLQALALVMPSYFGPTNLPPLEAFQLGVPVIYSDKSGLRDQVGDAAMLIDLTNPISLAQNLRNLIEDDKLKLRLIQSGKERLAYFDSIDRVGILNKIIEDFRWKRMTWK